MGWASSGAEWLMYSVYILQGERGFYVGMSSQLDHRVCSHKLGRCATSSRLGDPKKLDLIASFSVNGEKDAALSLESRIRAAFLRDSVSALTDSQTETVLAAGIVLD